ncbi:hypothetical protein IQ251_18985 [Saccharopolyspora sp. HNM0983]|uniref:Uncharacterized protein n=1 Tax=Saccharopolyspora montiporae TaxID=2781240 RepID=A0A929BEF9_9PSEU|nr:hypothetical protein [Saccharopolyspora sp. HNM0983]MBE9376541.1 hypothetical protein [Saccharopolyspora sp. HNM0983]
MTREQRNLLRVLSFLAGLLAVVLGVRAGAPVWSWAVSAVVLLLVPVPVAELLLLRHRRARTDPADRTPQPENRTPQPENRTPQPDPQPKDPETRAVQEIPLRSSADDYRFWFSARVCWRQVPEAPGMPHADPGGRAVHLVVEQAAEQAALTGPDDYPLLQHRLDSLLGAVRHDESGRVEAWAVDVRVALADSDAERLRELTDARKDQLLWERRRESERDKREHLAQDVLKTPGSTLVWWLVHNDYRVDEAVARIDDFRRLAEAAADTGQPSAHQLRTQWAEMFAPGAETSFRAAYSPPAGALEANGTDGTGTNGTGTDGAAHDGADVGSAGTGGAAGVPESAEDVLAAIERMDGSPAERAELVRALTAVLDERQQHDLADHFRTRHATRAPS